MPTEGEPKYRYTAQLAGRIEKKWQKYWDENGTFNAANVKGALTDRNGRHAEGRTPYFAISMFPYPSGKGLHVGHPLGYIATDMMARYHRMKGENVLHALGFDAFGLPAEQYAVQTGQHPRVTTEQNIANMRRQLHRMGLSFDHRRSFATTDWDYVRWTQWIFSKIYDSWYDPTYTRRDGGKGSARPISTLIEEFKNGRRPIDGHKGQKWGSLTPKEKADVLNNYRLAYISTQPVNWAPGLGTVLANEEVTADGRSERGNYPVFRKSLRQWSMRITAYGDRLIKGLDMLDWPQKVKTMQRNWIGESHGARISFPVQTQKGLRSLVVYTTRPDTIFGVTFMVVNPEHDILKNVPQKWPSGIPEGWKAGYSTPSKAMADYRLKDERTSAKERHESGNEKSGIFTGLYARNPVSGRRLPIFTADYVLSDYGTGAIMAVPGGDQRDFDFAQAHHLPVSYTLAPLKGKEGVDALKNLSGKKPYTSKKGVIVNSSIEKTTEGDPLNLNDLTVEEGGAKVISWLEKHNLGRGTTNYRLRDWLFSRQRYWGEPFPIVYDEQEVPHLLPDSMLPVKLPDIPDYRPTTFDPNDADSTPKAPLSRNKKWVNVTLDLGDGPKKYHRETNTMPNWAGSCWYYLRYTDPEDTKHAIDPAEDRYWLGPNHNKTVGKSGGVDLYIGGVEHAVLHLLYARFWHKVLYDLGYVCEPEPFHKLFNQGYIQAYAYTDSRGQYVPAAQVKRSGTDSKGNPTFTYKGQKVFREFGKMGKSLKNIITPDEMYDKYGADTFRLYEMSMGPLAESRPWNTKDVTGSARFLQRLWRNVVDENSGRTTVSDSDPDPKTAKILNTTIHQVTVEMENMRPNTAIARLIVLNNRLTGLASVPRKAVEPLILMLSPIAPHIAEELWQRLGHKQSLAYEPWPKANPKLVGRQTAVAVVQVRGKVRAKITVPAGISAGELRKKALAEPNVVKWVGGVKPKRIIVRPPKVVSIVL